MCEIKTTRVSVGHSWNAHGISGFDVELVLEPEPDTPGVDDDVGIFVGMVYYSGRRVWLGIMCPICRSVSLQVVYLVLLLNYEWALDLSAQYLPVDRYGARLRLCIVVG
jgi:hypothetical protein